MSYWKTGQLIQRGKYVIEKVLGTGGAGITYRAKDINSNEIVAIKTLNANLQAQADFQKHQERFIQEAFRLAKCSHAHVITVDDVCQEGELWCMVMEYIDGGNLETLVKSKGGFAEIEAIKYIYQVGSALNYIHDQGILHRDVKPANIMRRSDTNEAVLIDFGLARDFAEDKTQMHTNSRTEGFAPIEQYSRNAKRGAYTDVYALAATLYYLLTLQVPFPAQFRQQGINLVPPQQHNPKISDRSNLVILKGMELEPHNRPSSVNEWLNMLTENEVISSFSSSSTEHFVVPKENKKTVIVEQKTPDFAETKLHQDVQPQKYQPNEQKDTVYDPFSPARFNDQSRPTEVIKPKTSTPQPDKSSSSMNIGTEKTVMEPIRKQETKINSYSEVGIDYKPLAKLLVKQKWQEADLETQRLMLKASPKNDSAWIDRSQMSHFPCRDLETIDKLWIKYSRGNFGFSVQKRIYSSLGGKRVYNKQSWEALGDKVGWRVNGTWLFPEDLNYTSDAPQGHLPSISMAGTLDRGIYTLISRMMDCNLS